MSNPLPLALPVDLAAYLNTAIDPGQADAVLAAASAVIRAWTGQQLVRVVDDTITIPYDGPVIFLPQLPIVSVSALSLRTIWPSSTYDLTTNYTLMSDGSIRLNPYAGQAYWVGRGGATLTATYTHGYDAIPTDISLGVCIPLAARMLTNPAGRTMTTRGMVIDSFAPSMTLLDHEQSILSAYRPIVVG